MSDPEVTVTVQDDVIVDVTVSDDQIVDVSVSGGVGGGGGGLSVEQVQDVVGALVRSGVGVDVEYDDEQNALIISARSSVSTPTQTAASAALSRETVKQQPAPGTYVIDGVSVFRWPPAGSTYVNGQCNDLRDVTYEHSADVGGFHYGAKWQPVAAPNTDTRRDQAFVGGYFYCDPDVLDPEEESWDTWHNTCSFNCMNARNQFVGTRLYNTGDGFSMAGTGSQGWDCQLIGVQADGPVGGARDRFAYIHDDAIENDGKYNMLVQDCLFNGCFDFLSCESGANGLGNKIYVDQCLVRVGGFNNGYWNTPARGMNATAYSGIFKWTGATQPDLYVTDSVFYADSDNLGGSRTLDLPAPSGGNTVYAENITLIWGGATGTWPHLDNWTAYTTNLTVLNTNSIDEWNTRADEWRANHSDTATSGLSIETIQDVMAATLASGTGASVVYDDSTGRITVSATGSVTQAQLDAASVADRSRANHTGTQLAATISDFDSAVSRVVGGGNEGGVVPSATMLRTSALSVPNETWTAVTWEGWNDNSNIKNTTNPARLNVATAGRWLLDATILWAQNPVGTRRIRVAHYNGSTTSYVGFGDSQPAEVMPGSDPQVCTMLAQPIVDVVSGQYLTVEVWQDSGSALTVTGGTNLSWLGKFTGTTTVVEPPVNQVDVTFPIGVLTQTSSSFTTWSGRGVNTVVGVPDGIDEADWTAAADAVGLAQIREPRSPLTSESAAVNLIGWMQPWQPDGILTQVTWESCQANYASWKAAAPDRAVYLNVIGKMNQYDLRNNDGGVVWYGKYAAASDWFSGNIQPLNEGTALSTTTTAAQQATAVAAGRVSMLVIEAARFDTSTGAAPTAAQFRGELWTALIAGCRGIVYRPTQTAPTLVLDATPSDVQSEMVTQNALITALDDILIRTPNPSGPTFTPSNSAIQVGWRINSDGKIWVFALNYSGSTVTNGTITGTGIADTAAPVYGESRNETPVSGVITDTWTAYQLHIYQCTAGTTPPPVKTYYPSPAVAAVAGDRQATVSWTAAYTTPSPSEQPETYTILVHPASGTSPTVAGNVLSNTVGGLTNGVPYFFEVRASWNGGAITRTSPSSNTVTPTSTSVYTDFPDATNTGVPAGTTLTSATNITTTQNGQVIDARQISGTVTVNHTNVTIRRCKFTGDAMNIQNYSTGLVIEDCEFTGNQGTNGNSAVMWANFTMRRCNLHGYVEGLAINGNVLLEDNYLHDFWHLENSHADGAQAEDGSNVTIRHNTLMMGRDNNPSYDCVANCGFFVSEGNPHSNILIENNLVSVSGNYAIGAGCGGAAGNTGAIVRNNALSNYYNPNGGYYGWLRGGSGAVISGNYNYETGTPLT